MINKELRSRTDLTKKTSVNELEKKIIHQKNGHKTRQTDTSQKKKTKWLHKKILNLISHWQNTY